MSAPILNVTFRSLGRSGREWQARFECGSDIENRRAALDVAWKVNASIVRSSPSA